MSNIKLIVAQSNVTEETKALLEDRFSGFLAQTQEWSEKAKLLVVTSDDQTEDIAKAKTARLALKAIRVEAERTRKTLKEDSLRYGQAVQAVYNLIESQIKPIEEHLQLQEDFTKLKAARERQQLKEEREAEIAPYREFVPNIVIEDMTEENFGKLFWACKVQFEQAEKAKAEAEQKRIEAEKAAELERLRIKEENERLRVELAKKEQERKAAEEKTKKELEEVNRKAEEARQAHLEQVRAQRAELEAIEAKRRAEEAEMQRLESLRIAQEKASQAAPDKEKLLAFADKIFYMPVPKAEDFSTVEAKVLLSQTVGLLERTYKYLCEKAEKL
jgi:DNA repair exonuclease SbcCD ATPase subunit